MSTYLSPRQTESLRGLDGCSLANAIESFSVRLRNEGFADGSIHCLFPNLRPVVGHAVTIKIRGANPPTGAKTYIESTDWWDHIQSVPSPRIVVVQDVSSSVGIGAFLGAVHVNILKALGCVGAVTNGAVRDLPAVGKLDFQLFSGTLSVFHSYVHIVETGTPVTIGGLAIRPGEIIHGDQSGVQVVPTALLDGIPSAASAIAEREQAVIAECRKPNASVEGIRELLRRINS